MKKNQITLMVSSDEKRKIQNTPDKGAANEQSIERLIVDFELDSSVG
jgi:uncharacterized protein YggU (UPF0235/DUF167 family)